LSGAQPTPRLRRTRRASAPLATSRAWPGNQLLSLHLMHPYAPETGVPAAASSPVSHAARRRVTMPRTWAARVAAAGRWGLLTWPCSTAGEINTRNHQPGGSLRVPGSGWGIRRGWNIALYQFRCRVPLRDVQEAASHADPRTTIRYDRARGSLDRHATYIVAAYVAGAAR